MEEEIFYWKDSDRRKVKAFCVQGETGFLAFFLDKEGFVHILSGDDGNWHEFFVFNKWWLSEVVSVINKFYESVKENSDGR